MTVDSSGRKSDFDASSKRKQFQFNSPSRIESDFVLLHILGEGTTSQVRKAERKQTNIPYAIKTLRQELSADSNLRNQTLKEGRIMKELSHAHIVTCYAVEDLEHISLILEFVDGGDLFQEIARRGFIDESTSRQYFRQILSAVVYLHSKGIVHRDIKPENILLDSHGVVKLSDLGLAEEIRNGLLLRTICGTPEFFAPEMILIAKPELGSRKSEGYEFAIDLWALGVTLYFMLSGKYPFQSRERNGIYNVIVRGVFNFHSPGFERSSPHVLEFIQQLLVGNPEKRIKADKTFACSWLKQDSQFAPPQTDLNTGSAQTRLFAEMEQYNTDEESGRTDDIVY